MTRVPLLAGAAAASLMIFNPAPGMSQSDLACLYQSDASTLPDRPSPLDSVAFEVDGHAVKICYGRPAARGRTMIGGDAVPYGKLWRTGANEPTIIRTSVALSVAGVEIPAGTYAIYSVPGESEWEIILNRAYSQWGHEGRYTEEVRAQEVGRGAARSEKASPPVERFTISHEDGYVFFEWETTRVRIPISASS